MGQEWDRSPCLVPSPLWDMVGGANQGPHSWRPSSLSDGRCGGGEGGGGLSAPQRNERPLLKIPAQEECWPVSQTEGGGNERGERDRERKRYPREQMKTKNRVREIQGERDREAQ